MKNSITTNNNKGRRITKQFSVTNREETLIMAEAKDILDLKQQTITIISNAKAKKITARIILVVLLWIGEPVSPEGFIRR